MQKRSGIFLVALIALLTATSAIVDNDPLSQLITKLTRYADAYRQEKVHLHIDKPYYTAGDNIWFKAYVLDEYELTRSDASNIIYVELIKENKRIQMLKLPLQDGVSWGDFKLPDTLPDGNYRLRAYTQWMRNGGESFFFEKAVTIGNGTTNKVFVSSSFDFDKDGQDAFRAVLKFKDKQGKPYVKRTVTARLQTVNRSKNLGKLETDTAGEVKLVLDRQPANEKVKIVASIGIGTEEQITKVFDIPDDPDQVKIAFFPEGGQIVKGIPVKIAVKATSASGQGQAVNGKIADNQGGSVEFTTNEDGRGSFTFNAGTTDAQRVKINWRNKEQQVTLPAAVPAGYNLALRAGSNPVVAVSISKELLNRNNLSLVGQRNGNVFFVKKIADSKQVSLLALPTQGLPGGILQLTLLTGDKPVAERFMFLNNAVEKQDIDVEGVKTSYQKRSPVELSLKAKPGSYSVSVTNTMVVSPDEDNESNIFTSFLLNSDLNGQIASPNKYLDPQQAAVLDLIMLSENWRNISWTKLQSQLAKPAYEPEKMLVISGRLLNGNKPVSGGKVSLVKSSGGFEMLTAVSDADGRFRFDSLSFADSTKLLLQARTIKDKKNVKIEVDRVPGQNVTTNLFYAISPGNEKGIDTYVRQSSEFFKEQAAKGLWSSAIAIEEVVITGGRNISRELSNGFIRRHGKADDEFTAKDLDSVPFLASFLTGKIRGNYRNYMILVDGNEDPNFSLLTTDPKEVERIEALSSPHLKAAYGKGPNDPPIMLITMKRNPYFGRITYSPGVTTLSPGGYSMISNFFSPDHDNQPDARPDLRSTVYWNPEIAADENGKLRLKYFNTDMPGKYRIVIEGVGENKGIGRKVITYEVKGSI